MKILVLGNGFIGKPLREYLRADSINKRLHEITQEDLDPYDVVINTAAKTNIDWCEKNKDEAWDTNVTQAAAVAAMTRGKHVFFSSACIFSSGGEVPKVNYEDSVPDPQSYYARTKVVAEDLIAQVKPDTLIIRPRLLVSEKTHPRNTINKLLTYDQIITSQESATVLEDLIPKVASLLGESGPFNIFNDGTISPSEIMEIFEHPHKKITKEELDVITAGRAKRVSTILGTNRTTPLPNIRQRLLEIKANWK